MDRSTLMNVLMPALMALIMFGLGLGLVRDDFTRVFRRPRAAVLGLMLKIVILPTVAILLCHLFALPADLSVGMVLLAAAPTSVMAGVFTRWVGGDVALTLSITAVDSLIAAASIPLWTSIGLAHFLGGGSSVEFQHSEMVKVFLILLVPVGAGMWLKANMPRFASKLDRVIGVLSLLFLVVLIVGAVAKEREILLANFGQLGGVLLVMNLISLGSGYIGARLLKLTRAEALSIAYCMAVISVTVAMTLALSSFNSVPFGLPAAIYAIVMYTSASVVTVIGRAISRRSAP